MGKNRTNQTPVLMDGLPDLPELGMTEVQLQAQQRAIEQATNAVKVRGELLQRYASALQTDTRAKSDIEREKRSVWMLKAVLFVELLTLVAGCFWYATIGIGDFISARAVYLIQLDLNYWSAYILAGCTAWLWPVLIFLAYRHGNSKGLNVLLWCFAFIWIACSVLTTASYIANDANAQASEAYKATTAWKAANREFENIDQQIKDQRAQSETFKGEGTANGNRQSGNILNHKIPALLEQQRQARQEMERVRQATNGEGMGALYNSMAKFFGTEAGPMLFIVAAFISLALTGSNLAITVWAARGMGKRKGAAS